jgi:hypothetical protein
MNNSLEDITKSIFNQLLIDQTSSNTLKITEIIVMIIILTILILLKFFKKYQK